MKELVEQIAFAKKTNAMAGNSGFEGQIDKLVYQFYDLTEDEIAIFESEYK